MLHHNANFADRFRTLGEEYLSQKDTSFERHFAAMRSELLFEYLFFLKHVDVGYRADLCGWDWQRRFRTLDERREIGARCLAKRGWQASGLHVTEGSSYAFHATGEWRLTNVGQLLSASGDQLGSGRLTAVVLHDFGLSDPIPLGKAGTFVAPISGRLYLRCVDGWNKLADNDGEVIVRFRYPGAG
jgi:hypothetical protein